ncbi:peroxisomal membrane protein PEX14 isoform X2 [Bactrocera dorsalis]|uniref:Peroxisomal membrane protein PEX14 isoform X2 n=1 Tax=Bactrocera dorsalis TaxID=27457 RepID=A0A8N4L0E4_BACDO|nr:peroxisomal membrane protein PEX14 isoform X2 [Bactrocera dorsalis]
MCAHNMALARCGFSYETRWLLLLIVMCDMTNGGVQGPMESYNSLEEHLHALSTTQYPPTTVGYVHPKWIEPYFDPSTPRNVTALMGKSAYLSCRVRNLGNKTVSWIRHRDIHILTVGAYTYTSDQRFQATHHQDSDDWTLQIKWAQKRDAGMYECQISTQPVRSYFVRLNVVVPTATILGGPDLHVDKGSTINLTCTVKFSPEPPAYIFWYHHEEVINYDSSRGGVSVITEKGDVTTSFLLIQNADLADSGKYSCAPSNADVASVRVHVLNGEHPEAMQTGSSGCQFSWLTIFLLVAVVLGYQQQSFVLNAASVVGTTTTTTIAAKSNVSESLAVAAHKSATTITRAKSTVNRQLPHIKQTMVEVTVATTKTTLQTTTAVHKGEMIVKTTKRATKRADLLAADIYVALATTQNAMTDQQNSNGTTKKENATTVACLTTTTTMRNLPATMATSSSVSVKDSAASITLPQATTTQTTTTTTESCCNTTNMPTSSNAPSLNETTAGNATTQLQRTQANSRGSATPTACGVSVRSTKPKIDCNNMINKTVTKSGNANFAHFCNSSSNNNNKSSNNNNNNSRHTATATKDSKCSKSHLPNVSCSNTNNNNSVNCNNNNNVNCNNNNNVSCNNTDSNHHTMCHHNGYDVR